MLGLVKCGIITIHGMSVSPSVMMSLALQMKNLARLAANHQGISLHTIALPGLQGTGDAGELMSSGYIPEMCYMCIATIQSLELEQHPERWLKMYLEGKIQSISLYPCSLRLPSRLPVGR